MYVSVFGDERGKQVAMEGLKSKAKYVRSELGKRMKLRLTPEIRFFEDESFERGCRVSIYHFSLLCLYTRYNCKFVLFSDLYNQSMFSWPMLALTYAHRSFLYYSDLYATFYYCAVGFFRSLQY